MIRDIPPHSTIVAIATGVGGALGVVRLSGRRACAIADSVCALSSGRSLRQAAGYSLHHGRVRDGAGAGEQVVAGVMRAPRSYTGEDSVEISAHGSRWMLERIVERCIACGARLAEPGEFTRRAYTNGKIDLVQAESVAAMITAASAGAAAAAARNLDGGLSSQAEVYAARCRRMIIVLSARIDHPDEDIPAPSVAEIRALASAAVSCARRADSYHAACAAQDGIRVGIAGRANVGKSSLLNACVGGGRALVSAVPGTTRDVVEGQVERGGCVVRLYDMPGVRARRTGRLERLSIERACAVLATMDEVMFVIDLSRGITDDDRAVARMLRARPGAARVTMVGNKADLPVRARPADIRRLLPGTAAMPWVSAATGAGVSACMDRLCARLVRRHAARAGEVVATTLRQARCLQDAAAAMRAAAGLMRTDADTAPALHLLQGAAQHLGVLVGQDAPEDILRDIFSRFCVGK